jgi:anti-sigma factor RsiW
MKTSPCQSLDDYLDHDLEPAELARFVAHLSECPSCEQAVADHQRLENLLGEAVELDAVPENLVVRIESGLQLRRQRRWVAAAAALAATAATIWLIARNLPRTPEPELPVVEVTTQPTVVKASPSAVPVRISFPLGANVLVVREDSESPNITIVHVYSGLMPAPARAPARESTSSIPERSEQ